MLISCPVNIKIKCRSWHPYSVKTALCWNWKWSEIPPLEVCSFPIFPPPTICQFFQSCHPVCLVLLVVFVTLTLTRHPSTPPPTSIFLCGWWPQQALANVSSAASSSLQPLMMRKPLLWHWCRCLQTEPQSETQTHLSRKPLGGREKDRQWQTMCL